MSSAGIQSWTFTAVDNSTINGINIAENCPAANINNAVRQAMSSVLQEIAYQGTDISASVSMSLAGVDWRFMAVTGSASIIHVGTGRAGLVRNVIWNSPSTLVGSANIITDGGGNIVTGTNDSTMFTSLGSGAWRALHFPANGIPAGYVSLVTASATTVDSILLKTTANAPKISTVADLANLISPTINAPTVNGTSRNCITKNNTGTPNSKMDVTADQIVLQTSGGATSYLASSVSVTIDITASGANGLDTGSEASNTWYYIWLIYNGSAVAGLFSTSASSPTHPVGYTYSALVGAVRNNGSSNFLKTWGIDRRIKQERINVLATTAVSVANTFQSLSISGGVPGAATTASGILASDTNGGANHAMAIAGDANGVGMQVFSAYNVLGSVLLTVYYKGGAFCEVPLLTAQTVYWTASDTTACSRIDITGFTL